LLNAVQYRREISIIVKALLGTEGATTHPVTGQETSTASSSHRSPKKAKIGNVCNDLSHPVNE
jgi:hypothetical protein